MQLRRLNGCFGSVVAAWNLVLRVIFPKGDAESSAPGFRERPTTDIYFQYGLKIITTSPAKYNQSIGLN